MSTDTPRTDERLWKSENIVDGWDFCRTLERENARLRELIDQTALMLRGMMMDPAIPKHAKEALVSRIEKLEAVIEDQST